jgi:hypothetical protein
MLDRLSGRDPVGDAGGRQKRSRETYRGRSAGADIHEARGGGRRRQVMKIVGPPGIREISAC